MPNKFLDLQNEIKSLFIRKNIVCVLVFGSVLFEDIKANDFDVIIVVKKVDPNIKELIQLFSKPYKKIDFDLFTEQEIKKDLSFYTREFKLEYLSKGSCVYGKNIFLKEWKKIDLYKYKQSLLIRNIEYLQLVRQKYFSDDDEESQKLQYLKKYFLRTSVNMLSFNDIAKKLFELKAIKKKIRLKDFNDLDHSFNNFEILSTALIKCRKDFEKFQSKI